MCFCGCRGWAVLCRLRATRHPLVDVAATLRTRQLLLPLPVLARMAELTSLRRLMVARPSTPLPRRAAGWSECARAALPRRFDIARHRSAVCSTLHWLRSQPTLVAAMDLRNPGFRARVCNAMSRRRKANEALAAAARVLDVPAMRAALEAGALANHKALDLMGEKQPIARLVVDAAEDSKVNVPDMTERQVSALRLLSEHGGGLDAAGATDAPRIAACACCGPEVVQLLLDWDADVYHEDRKGRTVLHDAQRADVVRLTAHRGVRRSGRVRQQRQVPPAARLRRQLRRRRRRNRHCPAGGGRGRGFV